MADEAKKNQANRTGFTLIEILVVVAIIALLMAIAIPAVSAARNSAKKAATTAYMKQIVQACELYHNDFNDYPGPIPEESIPTGYTGSQNMLLGLSLRWYTANPPASAVAILNSNPALSQEITLGEKPQSNSAYGKTGSYEAYFNFKVSDLADLSRLQGHTVAAPTIPMLSDAAGYKSSSMPILYYRLANKWDTSRGSNSATNPPKGYAGSAPTQLVATANPRDQACFYVSANAALTVSNSKFDEVALWNLTDKNRKDLTGIGSNTAGFAVPTAASYATYSPRGGFVLISAGQDRIYGPDKSGNSDDIILQGGE